MRFETLNTYVPSMRFSMPASVGAASSGQGWSNRSAVQNDLRWICALALIVVTLRTLGSSCRDEPCSAPLPSPPHPSFVRRTLQVAIKTMFGVSSWCRWEREHL